MTTVFEFGQVHGCSNAPQFTFTTQLPSTADGWLERWAKSKAASVLTAAVNGYKARKTCQKLNKRNEWEHKKSIFLEAAKKRTRARYELLQEKDAQVVALTLENNRLKAERKAEKLSLVVSLTGENKRLKQEAQDLINSLIEENKCLKARAKNAELALEAETKQHQRQVHALRKCTDVALDCAIEASLP